MDYLGHPHVRMRWNYQNRTGSISHHVFCNAPDYHVLPPGLPMRRGDDQIDILVSCKGANIQERRAIRTDRLKFYASEFYLPHKLSHLVLGIFASGLL